MKKKLTRFDLQEMKLSKKKAVWITAYDYWTAQFAEQAGMDMILVGDSLGMCIYGYEGTIPVTMDQCIWHSEAVRRGAPNTFIIGDMPFLSYQINCDEAVRNAGRFFKEARVDAIKLEGGRRVCPQIKAIADGGMLVMGHIGLTPQSSGQLGGFKAQGRTAETALELIEDAKAIQKAGAFSLLVEAVPPEVCRIIRDELTHSGLQYRGRGRCRRSTDDCQRYPRYFPSLHCKICQKICESGRRNAECPLGPMPTMCGPVGSQNLSILTTWLMESFRS